MPRFTPHRITRGPLKGRYYRTNKGYRTALGREQLSSDQGDERYGELMQAMILQRGAGYARKHRSRFNELYRKAKRKNFDPCPPVYNGKTRGEDETPYAYLLDLVGVRPIEEFGWRCIGDTP